MSLVPIPTERPPGVLGVWVGWRSVKALSKIASALSLLLYAATVVLWVGSCLTRMESRFASGGNRWMFVCAGGTLLLDNTPQIAWEADVRSELARVRRKLDEARLDWFSDAATPDSLSGGLEANERRPVGATTSSLVRLGTRMRGLEATSKNSRPVSVSFPLAVPCFAFAILPMVHLYRIHLRRRMMRANRCLKCSYSLTGNTSGICPECGAACKAADPAGVSPAAGN